MMLLMKMKARVLSAVLTGIMIILSGCGKTIEKNPNIQNNFESESNYSVNSSENSESEIENSSVTDVKAEKDDSDNSSLAEENKEKPSYKCTFLCAGDNLIHDNIYKEALKNGGGKTYDFTNAYKHIAKYIKGADVAVLNQETVVTDEYEPSTYPVFCSPTAVGDKVVDMGFNVISMSNNHVLDKGADGLISSLDYWDSKNVVHYGAYRDEADSENIRTLEKNGIKFAFLGYMEHTNGIFLEGDKGKVIYLKEEDKIKEQIQKADKMADVVVVSCHFGTEISNELNAQQIELAPKLVEWGADIIVGTQAHTISTCDYIEKPDGGKAFCYYGLGNFFSTMYDTKSLVGIIGKLTVEKNPDSGEITIKNPKAIPIISHFEAYSYNSDWFNCTVYSYKNYTDELFAKNFVEGFTRQSVEQCLSYIPKKYLSIE